MTSAPGGIAEASVVTLRILPSWTMTMALVQSLPLASHSFPKRMALNGLSAGLFGGFSWPQRFAIAKAATTSAHTIVLILIPGILFPAPRAKWPRWAPEAFEELDF